MLASYLREPGATRVSELLLDSQNDCWMSIINVGELYYKVARQENINVAEEARVWLNSFPILFVDVDWPMTRQAASIKATYPLAYADCFAAALAQQLDAALVTGDREFEQLERAGLLDVEWLTPARA